MITITDKYGIEMDEMNFTVVDLTTKKIKTKKDGTSSTTYKNLAYCGSLPVAIRRIARLELVDRIGDRDIDFKELIEMYKEQVDRFESMLARFNMLS